MTHQREELDQGMRDLADKEEELQEVKKVVAKLEEKQDALKEGMKELTSVIEGIRKNSSVDLGGMHDPTPPPSLVPASARKRNVYDISDTRRCATCGWSKETKSDYDKFHDNPGSRYAKCRVQSEQRKLDEFTECGNLKRRR